MRLQRTADKKYSAVRTTLRLLNVKDFGVNRLTKNADHNSLLTWLHSVGTQLRSRTINGDLQFTQLCILSDDGDCPL